MPDLAVCFDAEGMEDVREIAGRLTRVLKGQGPPGPVAEVVEEKVIAVNVLKSFSYAPDQPFRRNGDWLLFEGALFDPPGTDEAGGLGAVMDLLAAAQPEALRSLNGQFNAVYFQASAERLVFVTDRLGSRPLYHGQADGRHVIASEIKAILAALGKPFPLNPSGLMELLAFGHNIGNQTVLDGIQVLPPGSIITLDASGLKTRAYFSYRYQVEKGSTNPGRWGERIAEAVREAAPGYLQGSGRKGIFLSGGLDSRIVAGALGEGARDMQAVTFGYPESRDVRYAAELAEVLGFRHQVLTYPEIYLSEVIRGVVARTECAAPFFHATSLLFHEAIACQTDEILVGFCGDVFSGGHLRGTMFQSPPQTALMGMIFQRAQCASAEQLAEIFQKEAFMPIWNVVVDGFRSSVAAITGQNGPDTADVWDVENRQRRFTFSAPKVDRGRFEVLAPLLDNRIVDLVLTLPPSMRKRQVAYKHAIVSGFPELNKIPWAATGRPIPLSPLRERVQTGLDLGWRVMGKIKQHLGMGGSSLGWRFRDVGEEIRRDQALFDAHLFPYLEGNAFPSEFLDREGILKLIGDHREGRVDGTHLLGTLLTLAVFTQLCTDWTSGQ